MAFRMMRYSIAAMQNHLDAGYKELPLVIPMLFYHGCRSPYPYSLCWLDEFAEPAIARKIYSSAFPLKLPTERRGSSFRRIKSLPRTPAFPSLYIPLQSCAVIAIIG